MYRKEADMATGRIKGLYLRTTAWLKKKKRAGGDMGGSRGCSIPIGASPVSFEEKLP
jgi:hypothetical protein